MTRPVGVSDINMNINIYIYIYIYIYIPVLARTGKWVAILCRMLHLVNMLGIL